MWPGGSDLYVIICAAPLRPPPATPGWPMRQPPGSVLSLRSWCIACGSIGAGDQRRCTHWMGERWSHVPGRWNLQAGPDFQQAVITIANGERCRGDIEIHRHASGWTAHQHHRDVRYNGVILHVCLWNDRPQPWCTCRWGPGATSRPCRVATASAYGLSGGYCPGGLSTKKRAPAWSLL
jgi:hypothetical protein